MNNNKRKMSAFKSTRGRVLGTGAEVRPSASGYKIDDSATYKVSSDDEESDNESEASDKYDLLGDGSGEEEVAEVDGDKAPNEGAEEAEEEEEEEEAEEQDEAGKVKIIKKDKTGSTKHEAREVTESRNPNLGDKEECQKDGTIILTRGAGIMDPKVIMDNAKLHPEFNKSLAKAKNMFKDIVERAEDNSRSKSKSHDFTDTLNKYIESNNYANDGWEECLIGNFGYKGRPLDPADKVKSKGADEQKFLKQGYHPKCSCAICVKRKMNDTTAKAKEAAETRKALEKRRADKEAADKTKKRELRKGAKRLRSNKTADEGCKVEEDWAP